MYDDEISPIKFPSAKALSDFILELLKNNEFGVVDILIPTAKVKVQ
jgi:hypothetical protein